MLLVFAELKQFHISWREECAAVKFLSFRILKLSSFGLVMGVNYGCRARTRKTRLFRTFTPPPSMKRVQLFPIYSPSPHIGERGITKFCENFQIRAHKIRPVFLEIEKLKRGIEYHYVLPRGFFFNLCPRLCPRRGQRDFPTFSSTFL